MADKKASRNVDLKETTIVVGAGKYGLEKGKEYKVHPILAETLIKKGAAAEKEVKK